MVEFEFWWLLVIPFFFALGWLAARIDIKQIISESTDLPSAYFKGLHYLITNQYEKAIEAFDNACLLYTSPSPRDRTRSRMPSSA